MESRKRKQSQGGLLGRRVRARAEPEPDLEDFEDDASSGAPSEEEADENENESGSQSGSASGDDSEGPVSLPFHDTIFQSANNTYRMETAAHLMSRRKKIFPLAHQRSPLAL